MNRSGGSSIRFRRSRPTPSPSLSLVRPSTSHAAKASLPVGTFDRIDQRIRAACYWREYYSADDFRVAVRSRIPAPDATPAAR